VADPLTAELTAIRDREQARDVPQLVAAVEAVLLLHRPVPVHELAVDRHGKPRCGHDPDDHYEDDGMWYCKSRSHGDRCATCTDTEDVDLWAEWPCPTYRAIAGSLAREAVAGG
jgi:hypothetical protein